MDNKIPYTYLSKPIFATTWLKTSMIYLLSNFKLMGLLDGFKTFAFAPFQPPFVVQ